MPKITGGKAHADRLKRLTSPEATRQIGAALKAGGELVEVQASNLLSEGSVSGAAHQPSAPGSPPNSDSRVLQNSIESVQVEPLKVEVSANTPYAAIQEFGGTLNHPGGTAYFIGDDGKARFVSNENATADMPRTKPHTITLPERPYMRPAAAAKRKEVVDLIRKAVKHIASGGKVA